MPFDEMHRNTGRSSNTQEQQVMDEQGDLNTFSALRVLSSTRAEQSQSLRNKSTSKSDQVDQAVRDHPQELREDACNSD